MTGEEVTADVVVVGAGLGGLATAIAARQVGRSVLVLERADGPSEVDSGITLWAFAIRSLRLLGLENPDEFGAALDRLVSYAADGRFLSDIDMRPAAAAVGSPSFDVHRSGLQRAMLSVLGAEHVRYEAECVTVRTEPARVIVSLADGSEVAGRIVVGADGVRSAVRRSVVGEVPIETADFGVWRGVLELGEDAVPTGAHLRIYGSGRLFGAARLDEHRIRWYAGGHVPPTTEGNWPEFAQFFGRWAKPVDRIVAESQERDLLYNDTPTFKPLATWTRGRIALVGDAAHAAIPTLGVSGGIAITDGLVLGASLARGLDPPALLGYEQRRRRVGRRIQREANAFARVVAPRRPRVSRARERLFEPPLTAFLSRGIAHLSRGAEAPMALEFVPGGPANKGRGPTDAAAELDPPVAASLTVLRRTAGVDRGPMELHCERVYRIALKLAEQTGDKPDGPVLRCAAYLHDIGLYDPWWDGDPYFLTSALLAATVLEPFDWPPQRRAVCLAAIRNHHALADQGHRGMEVELLRRADLVDVSAGARRFGLQTTWLRQLQKDLPRAGFHRHVAWLLGRRAVQHPSSAYRLALEAVGQRSGSASCVGHRCGTPSALATLGLSVPPTPRTRKPRKYGAFIPCAEEDSNFHGP